MRIFTRTLIPLAALLVSHGAGHAYDLGPVEIHGFGSIGYMDSTDNNYLMDSEDGSFEFNEVGLNLSANLFNDSVYVGAQVLSRDQGEVGNNKPFVNWALVDYHFKDVLGFKVGRVKQPIGLYNDIRDYDFLRVPILLPQSIYNENYRELMDAYNGAGLYGSFEMGNGGRLNYDLYYGLQQDIDEDGGIARDVVRPGSSFVDANVDFTMGGRIKWFTPVDGLLAAISYNQIESITNMAVTTAPISMKVHLPKMHSTIFSVEYALDALTLAAEYGMVKGDMVRTMDMSAMGGPVTAAESDLNGERYFTSMNYRFADWFSAGIYYSVDIPDTEDRDGDSLAKRGLQDHSAWQKDLAISSRFDITDYWIFKAEYHYVDGTSLLTAADNPDGFQKSWQYLAVKTTFNF